MLDLCGFITDRGYKSVIADMDTFVHRRRLVDSDTEEGTVDVDDYINIAGRMDGQLAATVKITRFGYGRGNYQRIEVYGEKGALRYNLESEDTLEVNIGNEPMRQGHIWAKTPIPSKYRASQMQCFADILNSRGDGLAATVRDGWEIQRVMDNALVSAEKGVRVDL
jgi:predicted dehydrogenase